MIINKWGINNDCKTEIHMRGGSNVAFAETPAEAFRIVANHNALCDLVIELVSALDPFASAADAADASSDQNERLGMGRFSDSASTGLGITFRHLYAAREVIAKVRGEE